jgi:hypothetical protein
VLGGAIGGVQWASLSASVNHTCGVDVAGAAWCFGSGANGRLGNGAALDSGVPVAVAAPADTVFTAVSTGAAHACGISLATGAAVCWGSNAAGQVSGSAAYSSTPLSALALTSQSSCGLTVGGVLKCWGGLAALMGLAIRSPSPPALSSVTAITVGAPGASDALCAQAAPCTTARAMSARCSWPPDSVWTGRSASPVRPRRVSARSMASSPC